MSDQPVAPVVDDPPFGYREVNVAAQRRDPGSLFNWFERAVKRRRECHEIGWGDVRVIRQAAPELLVLRYERGNRALLIVHNFAAEEREVRLGREDAGDERLVDLLDTNDSTATGSGEHGFRLPAYGYRWFRPGRLDGDLPRRDAE